MTSTALQAPSLSLRVHVQCKMQREQLKRVGGTLEVFKIFNFDYTMKMGLYQGNKLFPVKTMLVK